MNFRPRRAVAFVASLCAAAAIAVPASAQEDASATGTVNVAVRSVTVTPTEFTFGDCKVGDLNRPTPTGAQLAFPNGQCFSPPLTVTNGSAPANIHVRATDFTGSAGGTWNIIDRGADHDPGVDEVLVVLDLPDQLVGTGMIDTSDRCVFSVDGCAAAPGQSAQHQIHITGPASSTSSSPSYSTTITWTALP